MKRVMALLLVLLGACAQPAPSPILFVNGDFARGPRPASRIYDVPPWTESFTDLREDVIERELGLKADEIILTVSQALEPRHAAGRKLIVLGSNSRALTQNEVTVLDAHLRGGGNVLVYADWQYGDDNWASDNAFLSAYGVQVLADNFQPRTSIPMSNTSHPLAKDVRTFEVEGISQFVIAAGVNVETIAACSPQQRMGCSLAPADAAKVKQGDTVACLFTLRVGQGTLSGICDRNLFHNGPQQDGTDITRADNRSLARNLIQWLTK